MSKFAVNSSTLCKIQILPEISQKRIIKVHWEGVRNMKGIKRLVSLCLLALVFFLSVHIPIAEEALDPQESEVVIKHLGDNQKIIHSSKPIYAIVRRTPVFMIAKNDNKATEAAYHICTGRSKQKEGVLFKQRARSTIQVRSFAPNECYNDNQKNKRSDFAVQEDGIWITGRKLFHC